MDYYKNIDKLCPEFGSHPTGQPSSVEGLTYTVVKDLVTEPVDIEDFKQHARIDFDTDDNLITVYLKAAREFLEQWSQLSFGEKEIRVRAIKLPPKWKLMYGPYDEIINHLTGYALFGDTLMQGGRMIDITLTTKWEYGLPEAIKVAICRYAAGLYAIRENLIYSVNGVPHEPKEVMDEAQKLIRPFMNVIWP